MNLDTWEETNGRIERQSGPHGNMNAFKHRLEKRREEDVPTQHEENIRQQILDSFSDVSCFGQPQNLRVKRRGDLSVSQNGHLRDFPSLVVVYHPYLSEISINTPSGSEN
jgi:hypothetical protein